MVPTRSYTLVVVMVSGKPFARIRSCCKSPKLPWKATGCSSAPWVPVASSPGSSLRQTMGLRLVQAPISCDWGWMCGQRPPFREEQSLLYKKRGRTKNYRRQLLPEHWTSTTSKFVAGSMQFPFQLHCVASVVDSGTLAVHLHLLGHKYDCAL